MRKLLILSSALVLLGAGSATANILDDLHLSDHNGAPKHRVDSVMHGHDANRHHSKEKHANGRHVDRHAVTSDIRGDRGMAGHGPAGFSAAWGFGTSEQSSLPVPRYQLAGE